MPRFRSHGQLDDPFLEDGDQFFDGLDAYTEPSLLPAGTLSNSINMRIDRGVARVRKGLKKIKTLDGFGQALIKFTDPDGLNDILAVTPTKSVHIINSLAADLVHAQQVSESANGLQIFSNVLIFDEGIRPQKSTGSAAFISLTSTPSINDGSFSTCPPSPFGFYMSNRVITPKYSDSSTTIIVSDIFDENLFGVTSEFYLNRGTQDKTLSISGYAENQIIVFNKNSIHIVNNIHSLDSAAFEVTRQYGICGHRAHCQSGQYTYFMSGEGEVHVLVPSSDPAKGMGISISKVTLDAEPLSKSISPLLGNLNFASLENVIFQYHKNRVYIAVPLTDGARDGGNADLNGSVKYPNALLVYNSLNSKFESIDILPVAIRDMSILDGKMYMLTHDSVYEYESSLTDDGTPITGEIITRDYIFGSRGIKKFVRGTIGYGGEINSTNTISINTKNPDSVTLSKNITEDDDTFDRFTRFNARQRGYAASVKVEVTSGTSKQSEVRRVSLEGIEANGRTGGDFNAS